MIECVDDRTNGCCKVSPKTPTCGRDVSASLLWLSKVGFSTLHLTNTMRRLRNASFDTAGSPADFFASPSSMALAT